jgi:surface protein
MPLWNLTALQTAFGVEQLTDVEMSQVAAQVCTAGTQSDWEGAWNDGSVWGGLTYWWAVLEDTFVVLRISYTRYTRTDETVEGWRPAGMVVAGSSPVTVALPGACFAGVASWGARAFPLARQAWSNGTSANSDLDEYVALARPSEGGTVPTLPVNCTHLASYTSLLDITDSPGNQNLGLLLLECDWSGVTNVSHAFDGASWETDVGGNDIDFNTINAVDMSFMFANSATFNLPVSGLSVVEAEDLSSMFLNCSTFNHSVEAWNTAKVTNMSNMFGGAADFNQPLATTVGGWNTSQVTNMEFMFQGATDFNRPVGTWDTSKVTSLRGMFTSATAFNNGGVTTGTTGAIDAWNTSLVSNMIGVFAFTGNFVQPIKPTADTGWDLSGVTQASFMFSFSASYVNTDGSEGRITTLTATDAGNITPTQFQLGTLAEMGSFLSAATWFNTDTENAVLAWGGGSRATFMSGWPGGGVSGTWM